MEGKAFASPCIASTLRRLQKLICSLVRLVRTRKVGVVRRIHTMGGGGAGMGKAIEHTGKDGLPLCTMHG